VLYIVYSADYALSYTQSRCCSSTAAARIVCNKIGSCCRHAGNSLLPGPLLVNKAVHVKNPMPGASAALALMQGCIRNNAIKIGHAKLFFLQAQLHIMHVVTPRLR
jgi:hypothetical protein